MKKSKLLLWMLAALLLAGCSLAQPEKEAEQGDRWVGFYVVPSQDGRDSFFNNPNLEEYGSSTVKIEGMGNFALADEVLFAVEDEAGNYTFPGIDAGFSLFYLETVEEHGPCTRVVSNMGPHSNGVGLTYKDEGDYVTISGTVYVGPPLGVTDWDPYTNGTIWDFYRVYQTPDDRVYIDGSGDSTNGPMTHTRSETRTNTRNGETTKEETFSATAAIETVPRLEKLIVTQFDENNAVLQSDDLNLQNDRPEFHCLPETAWVLVEEVSSEGTERTVYNSPEGEDPVTHDYVPLDDKGLGHMAYLNIYAQ